MIRHKFFLGLKHFIEVQRFIYIKQMLHQQFDSSKNCDAETGYNSVGFNLHRNKTKLGISAWQDMIHN